jgi:3'(2'), 5'-bisphosphate nucleotidase
MNETDAALARRLAEEAGKLLMDLRASGEFDGKALGAEGDKIANAHLMASLRRVRPYDAVLSEEEKDDPSRLLIDRVWIIDPLDGTREYSEGREDWAVHVALAINGEVREGAVALPALGLTLGSDAPSAMPPRHGRLRMVVSRSRPPAEALTAAKKLDAELISMGSAGAKAMAVVRGIADIYLHAGGQYEWDNAAPVAVAHAAGLYASRLDGSAMAYNQPNPYLPDLLICRSELKGQVMDALRG